MLPVRSSWGRSANARLPSALRIRNVFGGKPLGVGQSARQDGAPDVHGGQRKPQPKRGTGQLQ